MTTLLKLPVRGALCLALLALFSTSAGCSKTVLSERKKSEPTPLPPAPRKEAPAGAAVVEEKKLPANETKLPANESIKVSVQQFEPKAWFQVCVWAIVSNVDAKEVKIGCNKDTDIGKTEIQIGANKDQCNKITLIAKIAKPLEKPDGCVRGSDDPKIACPYPAAGELDWKTPAINHWSRSTATAADVKLFKFFGSKNYKAKDAEMTIDPAVQAKLDARNADIDAFLAKPGSSLVRVFLEDQPTENYDAFKSGTKSAKDSGIDFDDYIVDIKGEGNVRFTVEGSGIDCAAAAAAAPAAK